MIGKAIVNATTQHTTLNGNGRRCCIDCDVGFCSPFAGFWSALWLMLAAERCADVATAASVSSSRPERLRAQCASPAATWSATNWYTPRRWWKARLWPAASWNWDPLPLNSSGTIYPSDGLLTWCTSANAIHVIDSSRPVIIEVPHFAALRGKEREIIVLRSDNGETWREHTLEATEEAVQEVLNESFDGEGEEIDLNCKSGFHESE